MPGSGDIGVDIARRLPDGRRSQRRSIDTRWRWVTS
jgi:hypothetical protein